LFTEASFLIMLLALVVSTATAAPAACGCANLTTCCTLWSGAADPGYDCDAGPTCNAQVCHCPAPPRTGPRDLAFASAHLYASTFTVGPEPVVSTDCKADMIGDLDANRTLQSEFAGAAGGATWLSSTIVLPLVHAAALGAHETALLRAEVHANFPLVLTISATDAMPADQYLFHEGPQAARPKRACPADVHCLVADPQATSASAPPCGFAAVPQRVVRQPVSTSTTQLAVDVTTLVASGDAILKLHVAPDEVQPSGAWAADLVMRSFSLTVQ